VGAGFPAGAAEGAPNDLLHEELQRLPGIVAQIMQKTIIDEVPSQDLRDAEDEMSAG